MLLVFEMCFIKFQNVKKFLEKIWHVDLDILCSHKVVSRENDTFCVLYKKDKF
jgi:hypothetical protein